MNLKEIQERLSAIAEELKGENADVTALRKEFEELKEKREKLLKDKEDREALLSDIVKGSGEVVKGFEKEERSEVVFNIDSKEYRSAYWKNLAGEELTDIEERAFIHTTENTPNALPSATLSEIWGLIAEQYAILGDIDLRRTGVEIEIIKHTSIVAGDAAKVAEGVANDDEQNTFVKVKLSGEMFSKHIDLSYKMAKMGARQLEEYLKSEIVERLGKAMNDYVVAQIEDGVVADNKIDVTGDLAYDNLTNALSKVKGKGTNKIYANATMIWTALAGIKDTTGRPLFVPSMDKGVAGYILGAEVREDNSVADTKIMLGKPKSVIGNMVTDIFVEDDKDIKKGVFTFAGHALFDAALIYDTAFAVLTIGV